MYFAKDFEQILNCEVQVDQTSGVPQEVQSILNKFKRRVETPAGVKNFFETCSEINTFVEGGTIATFDIVNGDDHFMYRVGTTGRHKIGFYNRGMVVVDQFLEDEYFNKFLTMLSVQIFNHVISNSS